MKIDLKRFGKFLGREAIPKLLQIEQVANDPAALIEALPWTDWAFDLADETGLPPRDVMAFVMAIKAKALAEVRRWTDENMDGSTTAVRPVRDRAGVPDAV